MNTLELKHLAPYLPYKLKVLYGNYQPIVMNVGSGSSKYWIGISAIIQRQGRPISPIPVVRPLSDLIREIEHNGEVFVPAIKLANLAVDFGYYDDIAPTIPFECRIINKPFGEMLKVTKMDDWVVMLSFSDLRRAKHWIIEHLYEWHFDVSGLIDAGLAIDINTLN